MNRPSLSVRIAGSPVAVIPLMVTGGWLIVVWAQGRAPLWFALVGCFVMVKTISSAKRLKVYKAWLKEWNSVGTFGQQPAKQKNRALLVLTLLAAALFIGIVACWPQAADRPQLQNALVWVWLSCGLFLLGRLLVGLGRLVRKRRDRNAKADFVPVAWMLSRTVDSPSRQMAVRSLPEYAARVLNTQPVMAAVANGEGLSH
jgi:hypothetical protein